MSRVPLHGLPGAFSPTGERRKVTRILSPAHRHYELAVTIGPCQRAMHSCRPVLDTGAGINLVRPNVLPANWQSYAEKLERTPRIRASPPMEPKAKAKRHECPTCGRVTGSPNVDPKQRRSRLNLGLPWMLTMGGPLLWPTDHPRMPDKESRWMAHRHITVRMPRVTLSIGVGWLKMEPGDGQTVGGASKQVCLEWRASKRARLDWPCR